MEEDDHSSSSEEEEEEWYDYLVRRPNDIDLQRRSEELLPAPTKVITSTYPKARPNGSSCCLGSTSFSSSEAPS